MSADRNGAHLLVAHLEAQGVEYVFGIPGAASPARPASCW